MTTTLRDQIRQTRPFRSLEQEAHLNLMRSAAVLADSFEQVLKPWGITAAQYNVLRILRGAEPAGLCRNEVRDRMLTRMPDMTRLLDRMEEAGLVSRRRHSDDRRQVITQLTEQGRQIVDQLDTAVAVEHEARLGHMDDQELGALIALLSKARAATE